MEETTHEWVWVWQADGGDYYSGERGALYRDGILIWQGYSDDEGDKIVQAVVGDQLSIKSVNVRYFHDLLADTLRDENIS